MSTDARLSQVSKAVLRFAQRHNVTYHGRIVYLTGDGCVQHVTDDTTILHLAEALDVLPTVGALCSIKYSHGYAVVAVVHT
mgnify:CR=1 FL=1